MIDALLRQFRFRKLLQIFISSFIFALMVLSINHSLNSHFNGSLIVTLAFLLPYFVFHLRKYRSISKSNLLEHINRSYPDYEESAQLIQNSVHSQELNILARLQKQKIEDKLDHDIKSKRFSLLYPRIRWKSSFLMLVTTLLFLSYGTETISFIQVMFQNRQLAGQTETSNVSVALKEPKITSSKTLIRPALYTQLKSKETHQLNFEAEQQAKLFWTIEFSNSKLDYFYSPSGQAPQKMKRNGKHFSIEDVATQTQLYKFSYQKDTKLIDLDGIYALSVIRDRPPKIEIKEPKLNLIEFPKSSTAEFNLKVNVRDDYGISDVKILASVAKGSGEAVKFRDKVFRFTESEAKITTGDAPNSLRVSQLYQRHWRLSDLEMEPGDEVYFSIQAKDNRSPNNQIAKSSSLIIRWLDEEEVEMAAEGIRIRFVPEYFRSQRQIIIETEKLVQDRQDLSIDSFQQTSQDLGYSQSDLKRKYGQYLGDEFGEGPEEQFGLADGYHGGESMSSGEANTGVEQHHDKASTQEDEDDHQVSQQPEIDDHSHEHSLDDSPTNNNDRSGATELIQKFGHNHGTIEIAPLSKRDPKSWMKMAVNEMWQAELHLMVSEPEKALPFEYNAYNYLKLARQAERIYAKRLGFEPPPVSEDRRLSGELMAILEYDLSYVDNKDDTTDSILFEKSFHILNTFGSDSLSQLEAPQTKLFSKLSHRLVELSGERPILIKYAAIAERVALAKTTLLKNCDNCIDDLRSKLWQLLPAPISQPGRLLNPQPVRLDQEKRYLNSILNESIK
ncbi:MAG: hypothetical protein KUG78_11860 [Kangiellaceae bacterium]|nr:hypothetical protein [Kangiellaceae bacterium]